MREAEVDHYAVLGVRSSATAAEIRQAYLNLARTNHPDRHHGAGRAEQLRREQRMQAVTAAWAVLGDHGRRRRYDDARRAAADRAEDRAAHEPWRPFDDGPVAPDPRLGAEQAARPGPPASPFRVALIGMLAAGVVFLGSGLLSGVATIAGAGIVLVVLGGALFLAAPLLALGSSVRNDRHAASRRSRTAKHRRRR